MNQPKVSVVIPVYNGANYLSQAIDSALSQTYRNLEVIVVNDGSTDGGETERIALSYGNKITYILKPNGGVSSALNLGIEKMTGEYFSWLSHDDLYFPDKIAKQVAAISGDPICVVRCTTMSVDGKGNPIFRPQRKKEGHFTASEMMKLHWLKEVGMYGCSLLIHRDIFAHCGKFDEHLKMVQDEDYWSRIMFQGYPFISIPDVLVKIRVHPGQTTNLLAEKFAVEHSLLADKLIQYYNDDVECNYPLLLSYLYRQHMNRERSIITKVENALSSSHHYALKEKITAKMYELYGVVYSFFKKGYRKVFIKTRRR